MTVSPLFFILTSVLCSSFGHVALKLAAPKFQLEGSLPEIVFRIGTNGWLALGIGLHVFALVLWVMGLKRADLSFAYPFISLGLILVIFLSWMMLKEPIGILRFGGTILIIAGVLLIAKSY